MRIDREQMKEALMGLIQGIREDQVQIGRLVYECAGEFARNHECQDVHEVLWRLVEIERIRHARQAAAEDMVSVLADQLDKL